MLKVRLPFLELSDVSFESPESNKSWVQAGVVGSFFSKRYKKFEITESMFDEMIKNLSSGRDLVDYDHLSTRPVSERPTPDSGKAAGWILDLQKRAGGRELWALVEWTKSAAELIRNKEYRFISPTIVPSFPDSENEGKSLGAKLIAMALTNLPFLRMAPIALSTEEEADTIQLAKVSVTEWQSRISEAFYNKYNTSFDMGAYIVDYYDNFILARKDGKLWKIPVSVDAKLNVTFGEAVEAILQPKELSSQGEPKMSDVKTSPEFVQLQADLAAQNAKILEFSSRMDAMQEENNNLKTKLARVAAEKKVDALVSEAKLLPKQRDWAISYALSDESGFDAFAQTLEKQIALGKEHGTGKGGEKKDLNDDDVVNSEGDRAIAEFSSIINNLIKDEKLSYSDAMRRAQTEHPELALSYLDAMRQDTEVQ